MNNIYAVFEILPICTAVIGVVSCTTTTALTNVTEYLQIVQNRETASQSH